MRRRRPGRGPFGPRCCERCAGRRSRGRVRGRCGRGRRRVDGQPAGHLTRDAVLDNITLYWLTGTGASAARSYWESGRAQPEAQAAGQAPPEASLPVGFTTFPDEIFRAPRSWAATVYPHLTYFNEVDKGGHFAAWEEPGVFTGEVRATFRSLR